MARKIEVSLTAPQELSLMGRYGRKCNPEGLIQRAVKEAVAMQAEDIGVFKTRAEFEAEESKRILRAATEFFTKQSRVPIDVRMRLSEFELGVPLFDKEGRTVSALVISTDEEMINQGVWLVAQFDQDNSEWYPVTPNELSVDIPVLAKNPALDLNGVKILTSSQDDFAVLVPEATPIGYYVACPKDDCVWEGQGHDGDKCPRCGTPVIYDQREPEDEAAIAGI